MRVQIPAYADMWMRGDRFGEVLKVARKKLPEPNRFGDTHAEIAYVKLDISGKTMRYLFDDCREV